MTADPTAAVPAEVPRAEPGWALTQLAAGDYDPHGLHGNADPHCGKCRAERQRRHRSAQSAAVLIAAIRDAGDAVSTAQGALSGLLTARDPGQGATVDESDLADEMDDIMRRLRHCARIAERRQQAAGTED